VVDVSSERQAEKFTDQASKFAFREKVELPNLRKLCAVFTPRRLTTQKNPGHYELGTQTKASYEIPPDCYKNYSSF
jgi:hypothetical protein